MTADSGNDRDRDRKSDAESTEARRSSLATDGPRRATRAVLVLGMLGGIANLWGLAVANPTQFMLASDVYLTAAEALLDGDAVYSVEPAGRPGYTYLYPPITLLVFIPYALLGSSVAAYGIQTALNVAFGLGLAVVIWRALERRGVTLARVDRALIAGFVLFSAHSMVTLVNGQVTIPLAFAIAVGFDALDRGRERLAGAAFALTALVKVFPAALGVWLVRRRAPRGVAVAVATGLGGLALGALLFGPDLTVTYLEDVLIERFESESFDGRPEPTDSNDGVHRQLSALGVPAALVPILGLVVVGAILAACYRFIETPERRLAAMLATVSATLLYLPLQPLYLAFLGYPLVLALYLLPASRGRLVVLAGTLLTFVRWEFEFFRRVVDAPPVPPAVTDPAMSAGAAVFAFAQPPTLGLWLVFVGCVVVARPWHGA